MIENERTPVMIDWNVDSLDGQIQAEGLTAGDYEVVFTDADSCIEVLNFTITEPPVLSLTCTVATPIQTVNGREGRVDLTFGGGTPPYQLQWNGPASDAGVFQTAQTLSLTDLPAGDYEVLLTDANGCAQNCNFFLTEPDCQSFSIEMNGQEPSCAETSDGIISLSIADAPAGAPHQIAWNVAGRDGQAELRNLPPGSYSVTVTNAQQCMLSETRSINAPPALSLSCTPEQPSGPNGSAGGRARLFFSGGTPPYEIQWNGPSTGQRAAAGPEEISIEALFPGGYQAVLIDANGCSVTCDFAIAAITCSLSVTTDIGNVSCPGATDGFIEIVPVGNIGPVSPDWGNDLYDGRYYLEGLASGSYQLYLRDSVGCELYTGFFIDEPAPLTLAASGIPPGCAGTTDGAIQVETAGGGQPPYRIGLEEGALVSLNRFPYTFESLTTGNYTLRLVDQNGCEIQQMVSVPTAPELVLQLEEDKTIFRGQQTTIGTAVLNFDPVAARWTPKTALATPDQMVTEAAPLETTTYTLTVTHASGCTVEDQIRVNIDNRRRAYVPNALRPESAENSGFTVFGGSELLEIKRMIIFDRWGNLIFEAEGLLPNDPSRGWDGRAGGQVAPSGVYVYSIELTYADGGTELLYGEVTLVR